MSAKPAPEPITSDVSVATDPVTAIEELHPRDRGWRRTRVTPSLAEVYRSVPVIGRTCFQDHHRV